MTIREFKTIFGTKLSTYNLLQILNKYSEELTIKNNNTCDSDEDIKNQINKFSKYTKQEINKLLNGCDDNPEGCDDNPEETDELNELECSLELVSLFGLTIAKYTHDVYEEDENLQSTYFVIGKKLSSFNMNKKLLSSDDKTDIIDNLKSMGIYDEPDFHVIQNDCRCCS